MTLITGFKCADGYAICADSQETVGDYRVTRQKLIPYNSGSIDLVIAGSGNHGELIDAFVQRVFENLDKAQIAGLDALKKFLQREHLDFYKNEASEYSRKEKEMQFLIGARCIDGGGCVLWRTKASRLTEVDQFALVGCEDWRYEYAAKNLYREGITTIAQGIFLGLYVMWLAEQTSNYVKAPISVVVLRGNGLYVQDQETINKLTERVKLFSIQFDALFLACPDTGLQHGEFAGKVKEFISTIVELRKEYIEESVGHMVEEGLDRVIDSYNLIPLGTQIVVNPTPEQANSQKRMQEELSESLRQNFGFTQEPEEILANLESVSIRLQKQLAQQMRGDDGPTEEEVNSAARAEGELFQAALMGPYKVGQDVCNLLHRVREFMLMDLKLGEHINIQLRIAVIGQTLAYLQRPKSADPQGNQT